MSIYSGFATRHQEETYDGLIEDLLYILQKRIIKFYKKEEADQSKFLSILSHIYAHLAKMEQHKYIQPKLSKTMKDLVNFLNFKELKELKHPQKPQIIQQSNTVQIKLKDKVMNKQSYKKLNEQISVGKIIKQLNTNNESNTSLLESRNTFLNQKEKQQDFQENPENHHIFQVSEEKGKNLTDRREDCLQKYLQKSKKQSARGYRKRQMKSKCYSSKDPR